MNAKNQTKLFVMTLLAAAAVFVARAQTGGDVPETAVEGGKSLWDMWKVGGPIMYPIGLCSVVGIGLTIYAALQYRMQKMARLDIGDDLRGAIGALDFAAARSLCAGAPSMLTSILSAGLSRLEGADDHDLTAFEKAMEEASVEEVSDWQKPLNHLSVVAQIAPMLGLLGTVTGMIGAFDKIGMGNMGAPEKLAADIGEAMVTTASGLIVAIPCMFAYFYFKAKFTGNVAKISRLLGNHLHHIGVALKCGGISAENSAAFGDARDE